MGPRLLAIACLFVAGCGPSLDARYRQGRLLLKEGKFDQAMVQAEAGLRAEQSWRFRVLKADILVGQSDAKQATELLASAAGSPSDPETLARLRMNQAEVESLDSQYAKAEELLQQAAEIAKPLGLPALNGLIENRTALVEVKLGRMEEAMAHFTHVAEVASGLGDLDLEGTATGNLGYINLNAFRFEESVYWSEKARVIFQKLGKMPYYYAVVGNLGVGYQALGDLEKALANYQQAETYFHQSGDRLSEQRWVGKAGEVLDDMGELTRAAEKFKQALALAQARDKNEKDLTGWWYFNLATVSVEMGDFDTAEKYNKEALRLRKAVGDHTEFYPHIREAQIAAGRKEPRAEDLYRALIAEYRAGLDPLASLEAQTGFAQLLAEKGQLDRADAQYRASLADLESQRAALLAPENRMTYLAKLISFYDRYINFLVDRNQAERALEVAESSRARVLDELLESKSQQRVVSAARMRELSRDSHKIFLSYWLGKKRSFLWAVTADGIAMHVLPPEGQIAPLVNGYRAFLENLRDPLASEYPAGRKLTDTLLGPVRDLLASSTRIVLVPDRSLHALNFETLPDPENPSKYLIERTELEVTPSLNLLAEQRPPRKPSHSLLLIGNPEQAVEEYPRLPFAANEVEVISKTLQPGAQTVLAGADAHPAAYQGAKPAQYSWIHFAAHAAANRNSPLDSALILSRHDASYQLLARDVMNIPLNATLVTLSACRGAGTKTYSGEGQVGLSWAFLRAGARSVVAGLWDVTDHSTAQLMADFYQQLSADVPPAAALRHAKLALLRGGRAYQKPFYWGPFQLYAGTI